jgi:DNA-binding FadR family transcriptional regulator
MVSEFPEILTSESTTERTYQKIARHLKGQIVAGEYEIGDRLPAERELASTLGVSRASLREALLALEIAGILEIRGGAGIFVLNNQNIPEHEINDFLKGAPGPYEVMEVRRIIEGQTAYGAALKASKGQVDELQRLVEKLLNTPLVEIEAFVMLDREFHIHIAKASGNSILLQMVHWLWEIDKGPMWKRWYLDQRSKKYRQRSRNDHNEIFLFIKNREAELARTAMTAHVDRLVHRFLKF